MARSTNIAREPADKRSGWQIRSAEALSFERAKNSFLAAMTHELRTPLNAIIGFAEVMQAEVLGPISVPQYRDYVQDILESGRSLLQIVEDVLEISRAEAGDLVLTKREVDLRLLINEALRTYEDQCRKRNISVAVNVPDDLVAQVDPDKMRRIIACLHSNAVKFSSEGSNILVAAHLAADGVVTLTIQDEGIGMEPVAIERAFTPFVQLEDKLSRRFQGAGLGLAVARLLTELHGGSIRLESKPGIGTTAIVKLPAYENGSHAAARALRPETLPHR